MRLLSRYGGELLSSSTFGYWISVRISAPQGPSGQDRHLEALAHRVAMRIPIRSQHLESSRVEPTVTSMYASSRP